MADATYTTTAGDTWDALALTLLGNERSIEEEPGFTRTISV